MKHDYLGHSIAAPVIKDPSVAIGGAFGDLVTTHSLITIMQTQIERLQDIAQEHRDNPGGVLPLYIEPGLSSLCHLSDAVEQRLKDSAILLQALEEHQLEHAGIARFRPANLHT